MFDFGFFRNPYVGRSFISPSQELRDLKVLCKFNPMEHTLKGRDGESCFVVLCTNSFFTSRFLCLLVIPPAE